MYAGVPTADLGLECSTDDCNEMKCTKLMQTYRNMTRFTQDVDKHSMKFDNQPWSTQNRISLAVVLGYHPREHSPASNPYGIFAGKQ
jgi:hypothetical protein